jgi:DNA-directed RNA polymerase subunit RPC12/RpoP
MSQSDESEIMEAVTRKAKVKGLETMTETKRGRGRPPKCQEVVKPFEQRRTYITAPVVTDKGIPCIHCGHKYDHKITNTYGNGNRRRICGKCGKPFVTRRDKENL